MERAIGDIFIHNNDAIKVVPYEDCKKCYFSSMCAESLYERGNCSIWRRYENKDEIMFIKIKENMKLFTKSDIKAGMIVKLRNNHFYIVIPNADNNLILNAVENNNWISLSTYNDDLTLKNTFNDKLNNLNIVKVGYITLSQEFHNFNQNAVKWIWEREETVELTMDEIAEKFGISVEQLKIKK